MDMTAPRALAAAIGRARQSAIGLCSRAGRPSELDRPLRGLFTELRLLGGALYSLETLATDLEALATDLEPPASGTRPGFHSLLRQLESLVQLVDDGLETLSPSRIREAKEEARVLRNRVTYVLASTQTLDDLVLLLAAPSDGADMAMDPAQVVSWLQVLNAPCHDRAPREYYLERHAHDSRRSEYPEYADAATLWPRHAEAHWAAVRPMAEALFAMPRSFAFVQWALEYARETWPGHFGTVCADPAAVLDLTDALCDGSASPLHFAASLGLPSLCRSLLSRGAPLDPPGRLGTPLFCALVGHDVLVAGDAPDSWSAILRHGPALAGRHAVVQQLLRAGSNCAWRFRWRDGSGSASLAGPAFWFACLVDDPLVFERVVIGGAAVDDDFAALLRQRDIVDGTRPSQSTLALLATCALDATLGYTPEDDGYGYPGVPMHREDAACDAIMDLMRKHHVELVSRVWHSGRLARIPDFAFPPLVRDTIVGGELGLLKRLSMDPRFDANASMPAQGGTIVHLAVGGDQLDMIDVLAAAGADFAARDGVGRTPLLVVESERMLDKLVVGHGLPTTDADPKGRNIWHYAAATNDDGLLTWLRDNDPSREVNLATVAANGRTPLDEALWYLDELRDSARQSAAQPRIEPDAARVILDAGAVCRVGAPKPPFLAAVGWGSEELARRVLAAGADPEVTDEQMLTPLHYLNLSATPALVSLVRDVCARLPVQEAEGGLTPAETMLLNTSILDDDGEWIPSKHPSCGGTLSEAAYTQLLTPEALACGRGALGLWARFCDRVLPLADRYGAMREPRLGFLRESIVTALRCLVGAGAAARYEAETGAAAVRCLGVKDDDDGGITWPAGRLPFVRGVVEGVGSELTWQLVRSDEGAALLAAAEAGKERHLVALFSAVRNMDAVVGDRARAASGSRGLGGGI